MYNLQKQYDKNLLGILAYSFLKKLNDENYLQNEDEVATEAQNISICMPNKKKKIFPEDNQKII